MKESVQRFHCDYCQKSEEIVEEECAEGELPDGWRAVLFSTSYFEEAEENEYFGGEVDVKLACRTCVKRFNRLISEIEEKSKVTHGATVPLEKGGEHLA